MRFITSHFRFPLFPAAAFVAAVAGVGVGNERAMKIRYADLYRKFLALMMDPATRLSERPPTGSGTAASMWAATLRSCALATTKLKFTALKMRTCLFY